MLDLDFSPAFDSSNNKSHNKNDPWGGMSATNNGAKSNNEDTDSDDFFPPISSSIKVGTNGNGNGLNGKNSILDDPWATPSLAVNTKNGDPWKVNGDTNKGQTNPWLANNNGNTQPNLTHDPWANTNNVQTNNINFNNNNNSNSNKIDDFDLFTTNRVNTPSSPPPPFTSATTATTTPKLDPFEDFFSNTNEKSAESTNPWTNEKTTSTSSTTTKANNGIRKTPESFLGENSSLVDLDNLLPSRPKSTNPFGVSPLTSGLSSSTSSGQLSNPFLAQQGEYFCIYCIYLLYLKINISILRRMLICITQR